MELSKYNPNITFDIVCDNLQHDWIYGYLFMNLHINWELIEQHPDKIDCYLFI